MAGGGDGVVGQGWGCPLHGVGAGHRCCCWRLRVVKAGAGFVCVVVIAAVVLGTASSSLTAGCGGLVIVVAGGCGWWVVGVLLSSLGGAGGRHQRWGWGGGVLCIIAINDAGGESISGVCTTEGTHLSWPSLSACSCTYLGLRKILKCCDYKSQQLQTFSSPELTLQQQNKGKRLTYHTAFPRTSSASSLLANSLKTGVPFWTTTSRRSPPSTLSSVSMVVCKSLLRPSLGKWSLSSSSLLTDAVLTT